MIDDLWRDLVRHSSSFSFFFLFFSLIFITTFLKNVANVKEKFVLFFPLYIVNMRKWMLIQAIVTTLCFPSRTLSIWELSRCFYLLLVFIFLGSFYRSKNSSFSVFFIRSHERESQRVEYGTRYDDILAYLISPKTVE